MVSCSVVGVTELGEVSQVERFVLLLSLVEGEESLQGEVVDSAGTESAVSHQPPLVSPLVWPVKPGIILHLTTGWSDPIVKIMMCQFLSNG